MSAIRGSRGTASPLSYRDGRATARLNHAWCPSCEPLRRYPPTPECPGAGIGGALNHSFAEVYVERYMINPDLGMKGKIDALVRKSNGCGRRSNSRREILGATANAGHAFQVCAYHLLLSQAESSTRFAVRGLHRKSSAEDKRGGNCCPHRPCATLALMSYSHQMMNMRNELVHRLHW